MSRANNKSPAFQFYPLDFIGDENVQLMENEAVGCYIKLMCHEWIEQSIPDDVTACAKLVGELTQNKKSTAKFERSWPVVRACFVHHTRKDGRLIHPRLERERKAQRRRKQRLSSAGRLGAEATHRKKQQELKLSGDAGGDADKVPLAKGGSSSSSSSSPSNNYYTDDFEKFWKLYPDRKGGNPKKPAFKNWEKRLKEGATPEQLIKAVRGYVSELSDMRKLDTEFVMQATTFLGVNERWSEYLTKRKIEKKAEEKRVEDSKPLPEISDEDHAASQGEIKKIKKMLADRKIKDE